MSAGAIVITDNEIHFLSDGILSFQDESGNWKVENRNTDKIQIIDWQAGVLWFDYEQNGIWEDVKKILNEKDLEAPWEIAHEISSFLNKQKENSNHLIKIAGFDSDRKPVLYEIETTVSTDPKKIDLTEDIFVWDVFFGVENNPFKELFEDNYQPDQKLRDFVYSAFNYLLKKLEMETSSVGGALYHHGFTKSREPLGYSRAGFGPNDSS